MLVYELEASGAAVRTMNYSPAFGHLFEPRPKRMLSFVIDQHIVNGVLVLEWISHVILPLFGGVVRCFSSSVASPLPIFAAGKGSIISSCAQSIQRTLIRPLTKGLQISCGGLASPSVATK